MESQALFSWQARERRAVPKDRSWYWAVAIVAAGVAVAAGIVGNYLFSLIAILGGFTVMLSASTKPRRHTYRLTDHGIKIGDRLIPFRSMSRFAIHDDEPVSLVLETTTLMGTVSIPLRGVDWRAIQMELKNRDVEETESLGTFTDRFAQFIGLL
ncbi:MAG: hypothetical protein KGI73_02325 [Patescibacteria group bacterium]|nr:hypothetical protein [Patescibacteria group bacterium]